MDCTYVCPPDVQVGRGIFGIFVVIHGSFLGAFPPVVPGVRYENGIPCRTDNGVSFSIYVWDDFELRSGRYCGLDGYM